MEHLNPIITDLALILVVAGLTTLLFKWLKQPVVLGYIVAGFLCSGNFFPEGVANVANVNIWAEIGIIFLLFSLGLEFSFKKLMRVGGSAVITALVIIIGMMCTGFMTGRLLGWSATDSVFLGGMLSMSSTTIIIKAFDDLGLRNRRFTSLVFGVLVVEDLFAVVLMVLLSSIYLQQNLAEIAMVESLFKLLFFLIIWFVVGIYLIPTLLKKIKKYLNSETLMVLSLGLCLGMVVLANFSGFSSALGAFIMGSILAETNQAEAIAKVTAPIKNLFGAIFFVSVGMLVDPALLEAYIVPIGVITLVVIVGQIVYSTLGFLISGQELRTSLQSSFSLAQIGEFAFIIATLGVTLNVTSSFLYPVAVAVSVVTTFTTPFIMRLSEPAYKQILIRMPHPIKLFLDRYSSGSQTLNAQSTWKQLLQKALLNIMMYSVVLGGVVWLATVYYMPLVEGYFGSYFSNYITRLISTLTTLLFMAPLLWALAIRHLNRRLFLSLWRDARFNRGLLVSIVALRLFLAVAFVMAVLVHLYSYRWGTIIGFTLLLLLLLLFWKRIKRGFLHFEYQFLSNLENKEQVSMKLIDKESKHLHLANVEVSADSECVGNCLSKLNLRVRYGITVVSILRGSRHIYMPKSAEVLMPHDKVSVVGTDTGIKEFALEVEYAGTLLPVPESDGVVMRQFSVGAHSQLIGMTLSQFNMMYAGNCLVLGLERKGGAFVEPLSLVRFQPHDMVWVAGLRERIADLLRVQGVKANVPLPHSAKRTAAKVFRHVK